MLYSDSVFFLQRTENKRVLFYDAAAAGEVILRAAVEVTTQTAHTVHPLRRDCYVSRCAPVPLQLNTWKA